MRSPLVVAAAVLVLGCTKPALLESFPKPMDPKTSATVVFYQMPWSGDHRGETVMLDGREIAVVDGRHYIEFQVPPGVHAISTELASLSLDFKAGERTVLAFEGTNTGWSLQGKIFRPTETQNMTYLPLRTKL